MNFQYSTLLINDHDMNLLDMKSHDDEVSCDYSSLDICPRKSHWWMPHTSHLKLMNEWFLVVDIIVFNWHGKAFS